MRTIHTFIVAFFLASAGLAQTVSQYPKPCRILETLPRDGAVGVAPERPTFIVLSQPVLPQTVNGDSITAKIPQVGWRVPLDIDISADGRVITVKYLRGMTLDRRVFLTISGDLILDEDRRALDADGDGRSGGTKVLAFSTELSQPVMTSCATIVGSVFDAAGQPLLGVTISGGFFGEESHPRSGARALPRSGGSTSVGGVIVPQPSCEGVPVTTDGNGVFRFATVEFSGMETFVVHIQKPGYSEAIRRVDVLAGSTTMVDDAFLQPLSPPVIVRKDQTTAVPSSDGHAMLEIPADALPANAAVSVTMLQSAAFLRDKLPPLVSEAGTFVDIAVHNATTGEPIDVVSKPTTLRVPNKYNLPAGTPVPFGKIDHHTLIWSDLRATGGTIGTVVPDGSAIEVQLSHFCSICTGYCLPYQDPSAGPNGNSGSGTGPNDPGGQCGNSVVNLHEGHLWESIALPTFAEQGGEFGLTFTYTSAAANPTATLTARVDYGSTRPVERTAFDFQIAGRGLLGYYERIASGEDPIGTLLWDGKDAFGQLLPTGTYAYSVTATSLNANAQVSIPATFGQGGINALQTGVVYAGLVPLRSNRLEGRIGLVNLRSSPYGAGWCLEEQPRLFLEADGALLLVEESSRWQRFVPDSAASHRWVSPAGDFSELTQDSGTGEYRRRFTDGTVLVFSPDGQIESITDRYGQSTTFDYIAGALSRVTSPTGFYYDLYYDAQGKLDFVLDSANRTTGFEIDAMGDLVQVVDAVGTPRTFEYDDEHLLITQRGARGDRSEYSFVSGRVVETRVYDTDGTTLLRRRNFFPGVLQGEISGGQASGGGTLGNPLPVVTANLDANVDGRGVTRYQVMSREGRIQQTTDGLNRINSYTYHPSGLLASRIRPDGSSTQYDYDSRGNLTQVREYAVGGRLYSTRNQEYQEPFSNLTRVIDEETKNIILSYDAAGRLRTITDHIGNPVSFDYADARHPTLPTHVTLPTGDMTTMEYDSHGRLHKTTEFPDPVGDPDGRITTFEYDARGNLGMITFDDGVIRQYAYDNLNRLIEHLQMVGGVPRSVVFDYGEAAGCQCNTSNLNRVVFQPSNTSIEFHYDGLNRLMREVDQLGKATVYQYDSEGNVVTFRNRNTPPDVIEYVYDGEGQLIQESVPRRGITTFRYDTLGNLVAADCATGPLTFQYDSLGRLLNTSSDMTLGAGGGPVVHVRHELTYTYDRVGNRKSMRDNTGLVDVLYEYTDLHQLRKLTAQNLPGQTWEFMYNSVGQRTRVAFPATSGVTSTYAYDVTGQLTQIQHTTNPPIDLRYLQYDARGNLTAQTLGGVGATYQYDEDEELKTANSGSVLGDARIPVAYVYDVANRLQADSEFTYTYDHEGRLVDRLSVNGSVAEHYAFDGEGRLILHTETSGDGTRVFARTEYTYDALGRRVCRSVNGVKTAYVYDGINLLQVVDGSARVEKTYSCGLEIDDALGFRNEVVDKLRFHVLDRLGGVVGTSDSNGMLIAQHVYDEFGNLVMGAGSERDVDFDFTGRQLHPELGLHYLRARSYDAGIGRFVGEDPIGIQGGLNRYEYVLSNPVNLVDPSGEIAWFIAPLIGAGVGAAFDLGLQLIQNGGNFGCVDWGSVGLSAGLGAGFSLLGPSGPVFGRAGAKAAQLGYKAGFLNTGEFRIGWSWHKGRNWFGFHGGRPGTLGHWHRTPIPGPGGDGVLGFGIGGGLGGGGLGNGGGGAGGGCGCR